MEIIFEQNRNTFFWHLPSADEQLLVINKLKDWWYHKDNGSNRWVFHIVPYGAIGINFQFA